MFILVFTCVYCTTTEIIKDNNGLSANTYDYKSHDNAAEISPVNEGFIILSDSKKYITHTATSAGPIVKKQTPTARTLSNNTTSSKKAHKKKTSSTTTTTTLMTTTTTLMTTTTTLMTTTTALNMTPQLNRRGRRLLNDPSYDTDVDLPNKTVSDDVDSFLTVNDDELSISLFSYQSTYDGSGTSMCSYI